MKSNVSILLKSLLAILILATGVKDGFGQEQTNLEKFISIDDLKEKVVKLKKDGKETDDNTKLLNLGEQFNELSEKQNRDWEENYFKLVSEVQKVNEAYNRYQQLKANLEYLNKTVEQIDGDMKSVNTIYKNRLKAIPTAYLILAKKSITDDDVKRDVMRELIDKSKDYAANEFVNALVFTETEVKNFQIVKDLIEVVEAGKVESFESDPKWIVEDKTKIFVLQKYRIFPEFERTATAKRSEGKGEENKGKDVDFFEIKKSDDINIPSHWRSSSDNKQQIENLIKDALEYNRKQRERLSNADAEYNVKISELRGKRNRANNEITKTENDLKSELSKFSVMNENELAEKRKDTESKLNAHTSTREFIVFTLLSEFEQSGGKSPNEQFKEIIEQAYRDLMNRASQLKYYKFYRVENYQLTSYEAEKFFTEPKAVSYSLPLRRNTSDLNQQGLGRLGVLLALKVKFESRGGVISKLQEGEEQKQRKVKVMDIITKVKNKKLSIEEAYNMVLDNLKEERYFFWGAIEEEDVDKISHEVDEIVGSCNEIKRKEVKTILTKVKDGKLSVKDAYNHLDKLKIERAVIQQEDEFIKNLYKAVKGMEEFEESVKSLEEEKKKNQ